ncbi:RNA polymerase, sigma subunit, RpsG/SigG [Pelagirhabdus alkalitolerans]|uniref:RNA polymerase sigma factor n=1 Tax=Pelagirhabdus alkalitolerans TaxID=1612202 RepID=A0A1G6H0J8_9BACI|nr:RNA polymerase sporulation sigma factor SigG [Pelagirhabdus alkalitolerans]SDB87683.1 RNA polymerase, sigma subunit, RpsG/SigG [Pelagirhabdus alkalitolerans]
MVRQKVEICGVDTSKLPVLKNDEMKKLFMALQSGDLTARETLVNGNLRLVLSIIQRFSNRGEYGDDLFQVGCIGLMKSIDNFDLSQNVRFSTYAVPMIIGEIRRYLRDNNPIRVSRSLRDIAYKALKAKEKMVNKTLREPTSQELADELGLSNAEVIFALDAIQDPVSLFEPIYNDGGETICIMDQISDKTEKEDDWLDHLSIKNGMKELKPREKLIINKRFFQGLTQMEVAEEIGISQAQVSRLEKSAIAEIKTDMFQDKLN